MMNHVDLSRLARAYDHRNEASARERARMAALVAGIGPGDLAIDVGGGRGEHARVFVELGAEALVVDRSAEMVASARRAGVNAVVGDGAALPIGDSMAALIYFHLSIHHGDSGRWLADATRCSAPGATLWIWTLAPEHHFTSFLARWFPSVGSLDADRFPDPALLVSQLETLGWKEIAVARRIDQVRRTAASWMEAVEAGFVSTLHLVSPDEIVAGLADFREAFPDLEAEVDYELKYLSISARRPSLPS